MQTELEELRVRVVLLENLCKNLIQTVVQLEAKATEHPTEKIKTELSEHTAQGARKDLSTKAVPPQLPVGAEETLRNWLFRIFHA